MKSQLIKESFILIHFYNTEKILTFLLEGTNYFCGGKIIIQVNTKKGCLQRGVIQPLLWSLVVDELLGILTEAGLPCISYAGGMFIIARGRFEETLCDLFQRGSNLMIGRCELWNCSFIWQNHSCTLHTKKRVGNVRKPLWWVGWNWSGNQ